MCTPKSFATTTFTRTLQETPAVNSACTCWFNGNHCVWSPQKLRVMAFTDVRNVTCVNWDMESIELEKNPFWTALTTPLTLLVPPGFETNPTKVNPPQLASERQQISRAKALSCAMRLPRAKSSPVHSALRLGLLPVF